jgi:hypothetical protein
MYCPSCGTQNIENAQFCRGCGENISLVPQALAGQMPENRAIGYDVEGQPYDASGRRTHTPRVPRLDKAISSSFIGLAFLLISIILLFKNQDWWFWMLIPAFSLIGGGIAEYVRYKQAEQGAKVGGGAAAAPPPLPPRQAKVSAVSPPPRASALPNRNTAELVPPPSITEGTTRHLDIKAEAQKQHVKKRAENQEGKT